MPKRKLFKDLSQSQKNRRLRQQMIEENIICAETNENVEQDCIQRNSSNFDKDCVQEDIPNSEEECGKEFGVISDEYIDVTSDSDDHSEIEDFDEVIGNGNESLTLKEEIAQWICRYSISHEASRFLLKILKNSDLSKVKELPSDPRTLLGTPETTVTRNIPPGNYFHYGLKNALIDQCQYLGISKISSDIKINIHIDGLPLAKSSNSQFYPILGQIFPFIAEPFVIGAYHGYEKPHSSNLLLEEFIDEYNNLHLHGFQYLEKKFKVTIRVVICDSPARNYVTCTKQHNAYFGCGKCRDEGDHINNRMLFLNLNAQLRTDENFLERIDEEHHTGTSIFEETDVGMVSQFPLDYMHLVCLGVTKKILLTFVKGPHRHKFSARMISEISARLNAISKWIPSEFVRKCRALSYIDRWKATEFRLFLLYVGPVVLQGYLPREYMEHFIVLHCAIRILCHEEDCKFNNEYANDLLVYFVEGCTSLYGSNFSIYNIHNLIHLASEVFRYGSLDSFSAFPFESFLNKLKKQLRKGDKPLQQLHRRIVERATCHFKNLNVLYEEPRLKGENKKGADEFGVHFYNTICYKKFKLSLRDQRDRFCYLEDDDIMKIIRVENIAVNKENEPILIGQSLINSTGFPDYPIDSKEFDIAVGNEWSQMTIFKAKNLKMKAVCVPYRTSFCFVPILHTSIESSLEHNGN